jgi:hypothetical protein
VQDFVHRKNLEHYRKLLASVSDGAERELLLTLLAEEEAKEQPPTTALGRDPDGTELGPLQPAKR